MISFVLLWMLPLFLLLSKHLKKQNSGGGANLPPPDGNRVNTPVVALIVPSLSKRLEPPVIIRTRLLSWVRYIHRQLCCLHLGPPWRLTYDRRKLPRLIFDIIIWPDLPAFCTLSQAGTTEQHSPRPPGTLRRTVGRPAGWGGGGDCGEPDC